jgi:hypothetical protein
LQALTLHALYPSRQYLNAKVKTFVEFIKEVVPRILESDAAHMDAACESERHHEVS